MDYVERNLLKRVHNADLLDNGVSHLIKAIELIVHNARRSVNRDRPLSNCSRDVNEDVSGTLKKNWKLLVLAYHKHPGPKNHIQNL